MSPSWYRKLLECVEHYNISTTLPLQMLDEDEKDILLYGWGSTVIHYEFTSENGSQYKYSKPWEGIVPRLKKPCWNDVERTRNRLISCMTDLDCPSCQGEKLNDAARYVTVGGIRLPEVSRCSVHDALGLVQAWNPEGAGPPAEFQDILETLDDRSMFIGTEIIKEIESRLSFLDSVGLDY